MLIEYMLCTLAIALQVVGIVGCFVPMLPGPPISWLGILIMYLITDGEISTTALVVYGIVTVVTIILDYVIPSLGVKYFGGTKWGKWGSFIGTIIGLFHLPWGLILGPFFGAFVGELIGRSGKRAAFKSGLGSVLGFLAGVLLKFVVCIYFLYVTIAGVVGYAVS